MRQRTPSGLQETVFCDAKDNLLGDRRLYFIAHTFREHHLFTGNQHVKIARVYFQNLRTSGIFFQETHVRRFKEIQKESVSVLNITICQGFKLQLIRLRTMRF